MDVGEFQVKTSGFVLFCFRHKLPPPTTKIQDRPCLDYLVTFIWRHKESPESPSMLHRSRKNQKTVK